jgi:hypothetical protein
MGEYDGRLYDQIIDYVINNDSCLDLPTITTATMAYDTNIRMDYKELSKIRKSKDLILGVKSPDIPIEELLKNPYTKALKNMKKKTRKTGKTTIRAAAGNGLFFQSSVEYVVGTPEKQYIVRISPKGGSVQVQGLDHPIYVKSDRYVDYVLNHIAHELETTPFTTSNKRTIIINAKTKYTSQYDYLKINVIPTILSDPNVISQSPYKIAYVTSSDEVESAIMIKFVTPIIRNPNRQTTVKIFTGKKINILGGCHIIHIMRIYRFLDMIFREFSHLLNMASTPNNQTTSTTFDWTTLF